MKKPGRLLKAATVTSSVLLVAGFIGYRAGALDWLVGTGAAEPERVRLTNCLKTISFGLSDAKPKGVTPTPSTQVDPAFMSSSKTIIFVEPPKTKQTAPNSPATKASP